MATSLSAYIWPRYILQGDAKRNDKKNDEKVKDSTNLYVCVWILEKSKTCKTFGFLLSKILNKIERKKILRFNRHPNQKSKVDVCVSFWMTILIHVCVLGPWTTFNPWFNPSLRSFLWKPTMNDFTKHEKFALLSLGFC